MTLIYVLIAILLLGILVTAHEFGHFMAARACGIAVNEFAIGFGPKLFGWKSKKHETQFSLRLLPLGGYCAFFGEDDAEGKHTDDPRAYARQSVWKRMLTVLMGPGMNFILAFVVLTGWFWATGMPVVNELPAIVEVEENGPAAQAGVMPGDLIARVAGEDMAGKPVDAVLEAIRADDTDAPVQLTLRRGEEEIELAVPTFYDAEAERYRMGVSIGQVLKAEQLPDGTLRPVYQPMMLTDAAGYAWRSCVSAGSMIFDALKGLVTRGEGLDQTAGPVGVISMVSDQVRTGGFSMFLNMLVVISINLGVMNLLPIPGLDGSRFLFMLVEAIRRKPIKPEREAIVHLVGMALLFGLMILLTFRDVARLIH